MVRASLSLCSLTLDPPELLANVLKFQSFEYNEMVRVSLYPISLYSIAISISLD